MRKIHKTLTLTLIWIQNDTVCVDVFVHMSSICVSLMVVCFFFFENMSLKLYFFISVHSVDDQIVLLINFFVEVFNNHSWTI
jgi:hypothetical protein